MDFGLTAKEEKIQNLKKENGFLKELVAHQEKQIKLMKEELRVSALLQEKRLLEVEIKKESKRQGYLPKGEI